MTTLLLWILAVLGLLLLLLGIFNPRRGGMSWAGFGLLLILFGAGGAWLHRQFGVATFWVLGILSIVLLVWALANLRRGRWAAWMAGLAVLLGLAGFGSVSLLGSPNPNLLTNNSLPDPLNYFLPATPTPSTASQPATPATPDSAATPTPPQPETPATPAPETPAPEQPQMPESPNNPGAAPDNPTPPPTMTPATPSSPEPTPTPVTSVLREAEPTCPCPLNVSVNVPEAKVTILKDANAVVSSTQQKSVFQLESGDYTLQVEAVGYKTLSALISVPKNKNLEVELVK